MCPGWTSIYFFTVPKFSDCGMLAAHHTVSFLSPQLDSFCFTIQSIKQIQETSKGAWNEPINNANKNITIFKRVEQHQNIVVTEHFSVIWTENQNWKKKKQFTFLDRSNFDDFISLHTADYTNHWSQHSIFRTICYSIHRRRIGKHTTITWTILKFSQFYFSNFICYVYGTEKCIFRPTIFIAIPKNLKNQFKHILPHHNHTPTTDHPNEQHFLTPKVSSSIHKHHWPNT